MMMIKQLRKRDHFCKIPTKIKQTTTINNQDDKRTHRQTNMYRHITMWMNSDARWNMRLSAKSLSTNINEDWQLPVCVNAGHG